MVAGGEDRIAPEFAEGEVITIFRSRRRPGSEADHLLLSAEMQAAARAVPGFVDFATFAADDGERVSLVTFDSPAAHDRWRDDPGHRRAQLRGRQEFYLSYSVQVGMCTHVSQWGRLPD